MSARGRLVLTCLAALCLPLPSLPADRALTAADWDRLRKGDIIVEAERNDDGGSSAWSVALLDHPAALVWRAVCSPQLFERYLRYVPRSLLLDPGVPSRLQALGDAAPDEVERLLRDLPPVATPPWSREPDGRWTAYSYQRARLPWPLRDRWVVVRITSDDATMTQTWVRVTGTMKEDRGSWKVTPISDAEALLTNEMRVDLPDTAARLFTPLGLKVSVRDTLRGIHALAQDLSGAAPACSECPGNTAPPSPP